MTIQRILLYLLLILLPIQLGRHFFFDFSTISGLRSDYLAPTIYLTDLIILLMILIRAVSGIRKIIPKKILQKYIYLFFVLCSLFFVNLFVAQNPWVSLYKWIKVVEFMALGLIIVRLKPKFTNLTASLSIAVIYSSVIAVWQFAIQRSIGGLFWFLGERTFYSSTPGIAAFSWQGRLILRPYSLFSHPNVLAGFLAAVLPIVLSELIFLRKKMSPGLILLFILSLILGITALVLTFSRFTWLVFILGVVFNFYSRKKNGQKYLATQGKLILILFFASIIISIVLPQVLFVGNSSMDERRNLIKAALDMASQNPLFGVGLNNFIVSARQYLASSYELYIYQPVHNIYLLVLAETGAVGFFLFSLFIAAALRRSISFAPVFWALAQILILGLFDHYLITLQQGQLLFTLLFSLAFLRQNSYTDNTVKKL